MLAVNKAVSVAIGPSGVAIIGQFQNVIQISMTVAQGGVNTGVTKYIAEYNKSDSDIRFFICAAFYISLFCTMLVSLALIFFSGYISEYILNDDTFSYVFVLFGGTIFLYVGNQLFLSIYNGLKEINSFVFINIVQSVFSLFYTTTLVFLYGVDGALISLVTNQSIVFLIALYHSRNHGFLRLSALSNGVRFVDFKRLLKYSVMTITTAIVVPVSHIFVRNHIAAVVGNDEAGYWQAIWYISMMYLMVVTTTLSIYYLPRLSELVEKKDVRKELFLGYKVLIPIVSFGALAIYMMRDFIILLLFSDQFLPMRTLFAWQLMGDVVKIAGWLLAYIMLAKAMMKLFVVTEVLFSVLFVILSYTFLDIYGLVGVTYAFFTNYLIYFFVMLACMRRELS
ncbi:O-antigen translocase [Halomonas sp. SCS19]